MQVPFRLTRMLVKAMEVSGIEGNFRSTCENVMQVLRTNRHSVMAMMEVYKMFLCYVINFSPQILVSCVNSEQLEGWSHVEYKYSTKLLLFLTGLYLGRT